MAEFRSIKCAMWREDDWFLDLPTDGKLLWVYLFSNPSASVAGIYRLSLRTMTNETGLPHQRIAELLDMFAAANKAHFADGVLWVVKMREHQASKSPKVMGRIRADIASIPKDNRVYRMYAEKYGIDTVSVPIHTDTDTDTDTVTVTDTTAAPRSRVGGNGSADEGWDDDDVSPMYTRIRKAWEQTHGRGVMPHEHEDLRDMIAAYGESIVAVAIPKGKGKHNPISYTRTVAANMRRGDTAPAPANGKDGHMRKATDQFPPDWKLGPAPDKWP